MEGNRQSEQMLGITREVHAQRRIDSKEWQIIRKDGTPMPVDEYASTRALRENRLIENVEMGIVKDKGEITWISVTAAPIPLEGYGVAIAYGDITERLSAEQAGKRAEETLRRSEENFRHSLDGSPFGVRIVTIEGETIYANRAILDIYGYDSLEELRMTSIENRYTPESHAGFLIRREKRKQGVDVPSEYTINIIRKDGEIRHIQVFRKEILWDGERQFQVLYNNITERRQAENALRESEERLRFHTDNSPMAVVEWNTDFVVTRWTGAAEKMFGWSFEETIGKPIMELRMICEEDIPIVQSVMQRLTDGKSKHVVSSNRNYTKKGEVIHCEWYNSVLHDSAGKMISVMSQVLDVTERKLAEEALRKSEENFRRSLDDSPLGVRIVTVEGETIYANRVILDIYGYDSIEELNTTPVKKRYSPESYAEFQIRKEKRWQGVDVPSEYEVSIVRKNGEVRHLQVFRKDVLWDGERQFQTVYQDITERKQAEEALAKSEERLKNLYQESPIPTFTWQKKGGDFILVDFNRAAIQITNGKVGYRLGDSAEALYKNRPQILNDMNLCFQERSVVRREITSRNFAPGRFLSVHYGFISPDLIIVHTEDQTERKRAEEKLHASLREKEILLSEVHHRVKNNMQVISGLLDLQARSSGNPELTGMLNESQSRIRSMALIHEKLYGSKDFARIDLADYVRTLSQDLFKSYKISPGKIDLIVKTDGDVYVDINKAIPCGLILNELISNALKHAFPIDGPGKIKIILRETKNTEIEIVVRDNGLGLPDDVDIHQPRSVGLHLVNGLVKNQLDGQIEVRRDNGTEFRIKFPL